MRFVHHLQFLTIQEDAGGITFASSPDTPSHVLEGGVESKTSNLCNRPLVEYGIPPHPPHRPHTTDYQQTQPKLHSSSLPSQAKREGSPGRRVGLHLSSPITRRREGMPAKKPLPATANPGHNSQSFPYRMVHPGGRIGQILR